METYNPYMSLFCDGRDNNGGALFFYGGVLLCLHHYGHDKLQDDCQRIQSKNGLRKPSHI
jgi:hypothetical protein